ncbi:hypothetical protein LUZ63_011576 [Rhynchospora breviuscula]|uniref:Myb/SANT-like domain-containing protein n=1 Tax=Rhynchospora breviuscula TaxID=2022672 RepID=A0A9Q0CJA4_9POAL|nr:hypothetical protein LUZ63_011576 [Rhynchospora breviuscula]
MRKRKAVKEKSTDQLHHATTAAPVPISMRSLEKGARRTYPLNHRWSRKGCSNFRWSPAMSRFLLLYLVEQAKMGKANFRRHAFTNAAQAVAERYNIAVTDTNVLNHVRTIRARFRRIRRLQCLDNVSWDVTRKTIYMDDESYHDHIKENPKDEPFLNKKIEMYEEMCVICGDNNNETAQNLSGSSSEEEFSDNDDLDGSDDMIKESPCSPPYDASAYVLSKRRHCQGQNGIVKPYSSVQQPKARKKGCTNFRWNPYMSRFLLSYIVNQVKLGLVKQQILKAAAQFISEQFSVNCSIINVENHLRTIRGKYMRIKKLQIMDNVTWDDEAKIIAMDDNSYHEHIRVEPKDEQFLNKSIDMYDEMGIIFGQDQTGDDVPLEWTDHDDMKSAHHDNGYGYGQGSRYNAAEDSGGQSPLTSSSSGSLRRTHLHKGECNGNRDDGNQQEFTQWAMRKLIIDLSAKVGLLADSIGDLADAVRSSTNKTVCVELYQEVMKCEGYDEISLGRAFDYLNEHEHLGRGFLVKSQRLRQIWLSEFFSNDDHAL